MSYLVSSTFHFKETLLLYMFHSFHAGTETFCLKTNKSVGRPCQSLLSMHLVHLLLIGSAGHWSEPYHTFTEAYCYEKRLGLSLVITALPLIPFWSITVSDQLSSENSEISPSHHQQHRLAHQRGSEQVCKQRLPHSPLADLAAFERIWKALDFSCC